MFPSAIEKKREYVEKRYPKFLGKIREAIEKCSEEQVSVDFDENEWSACNYSDIEWFLESYNYSCSYESGYINVSGSYDKEYTVCVSWRFT
jgi:hypothetical protein